MKLETLKLVDFKPFYGEHEIEFSTNESKPITLFIGENGHGKTTIMNAINWALTDTYTAAFTDKDRLVNKDALHEGRKECFVTLTFRDVNRQIRIQRSKHVDFNRSELSVYEIGSEGNTGLVKGDPNVFLARFFPPTLAQWFIFDGEDVRKLGLSLSGSPQFKRELQLALGFDSLVTLEGDLSALIKKYQKLESKAKNNDQLDTIEKDIERYEGIETASRAAMEECSQNVTDASNRAEGYRRELSGFEETSSIQKRQDRANAELKQIKERLRQKFQSSSRLLGKSAAALALRSALEKLDEALLVKEDNQSIPSPYSDRLVDDILAKALCICGREVSHGSQEEGKIVALRESASTSTLNMRITQIRSKITMFKNFASDFQQQWSDIQDDINELNTQKAEQDQIVELTKQSLNSVPLEHIKATIEKQQKELTFINEQNFKKGQFSVAYDEAKSRLKQLNTNREILLNGLKRDSGIASKILKFDRLRRHVNSEFKRQETEVLSVISSELSNAIQRFFTKNYFVRVDAETYRMEVLDSDNRPAILSPGERALVGLAFVSTMVGMASSNTKIASVNWISDPVVSPLILDAPFSHLDSEYRLSSAMNISEQVKQLVLMSFSDPIERLYDSLATKIGRLYLIESHAKGESKGIQKSVLLGDVRYPLNFYNSPRDESKLRKVG